MQRFASFVVKSKWIIISIFIIATAVCGYMVFQNKILYDLSAYAPSNSNTEKAVQVLKQEFDDKGSAYVMVRKVGSESDAQAIAQELSGIEGVAAVMLTKYNNNSALYNVMLSDYDATKSANAAIAGIINHLDDKEAYLTGQSASSYYTQQETFESIIKVGIIIVIAILAMLIFTSKTYFEVVIMLLVFGVSVVLNMGTNFLFNGISYVSNLVALVLQLALSLDYSVILLHRFMEEYEVSDAPTAAANALRKGFIEIMSSSLTTIAGLSALLLMTLPIGVEMGISLTKSIVASLICVIFLMPSLLVIFANTLRKTKHKSFVPNITKPVRSIIKARKVIVPIFLAIVILAGTGQFFNKYSYNINGADRIVRSNAEVSKDFGMINSLVIIVPKGNYQQEKALTRRLLDKEIISEASGIAAIEVAEGLTLADEIGQDDIVRLSESFGLDEVYAQTLFVLYVYSKGDTGIPIEDYKVALIDLLQFAYEMTSETDMDLGDNAAEFQLLMAARQNLEGSNYSRIIFNINSAVESQESLNLIKELYAEVGQYYQEFYIAGESAACYDMALAFPTDNIKVSLCTVFFVLFILLLTFRNLLYPPLLMLAILGGMWINFSIPLVSGNPVSFIGYLLISAIQMGATIDYGIVLTSRFRSTKLLQPDKLLAIAQAENAVFPTIITSGTILTVTGFSLGILASGVVGQMGMLLGVGALSSMLIVLFILPSLLLVTDKFSEKTDFSMIISSIKKRLKNSPQKASKTSRKKSV